MERELPVIEIHGTPFYVDVSRQELRECALRKYPPVADMKARIVPWSETPFRQIITENRKKQQQQQRKSRKL